MTMSLHLLVTAMFFLQAGQDVKNPWKDQVESAVLKAQRTRTIVAYREALDVAYRADDWRAGLDLAKAAYAEYPDNAMLFGRLARAFWRGGLVESSEKIVDQIDLEKTDQGALATYIEIQLARGKYKEARQAARILEKLGPASALEYYHVLSVRLADHRFEGVPELLRKAAELVDPENGYPELYLEEVLEGLPEFFEAIGPEPVNQITSYGSTEMPLSVTLRLPYCYAMINGKGPYRLVVDTGGSITLSLDDDIADELGLKSHGTAPIRGVSGKQDSQQTLVDELRLGGIVCRRVMTRTFAMPELITLAADGIIGTGVFTDGRMSFDFEHEKLVVAPTSDKSAAGEGRQVLVIGDAKIMTHVKIDDHDSIALLDSGADVAALAPSVVSALYPGRNFQGISASGLGVGEGAAAGVALTPGIKLDCWGHAFDNYSGVSLDVLDDLLSPVLGMQTQILIGMPVFRSMNSWTIDYPRRRMWVEWVE